MTVRNAKETDIPRLLELLTQVQAIHAQGRPDLFEGTHTKYRPDDLRAILRSGKDPEEIRRLLREATEREIARKPEGHHFAQDEKETGFFSGEEGRGMSQIGG